MRTYFFVNDNCLHAGRELPIRLEVIKISTYLHAFISNVASSALPAVIRKNVINITMVITSESCINGEFDQSSLLSKLEEVVTILSIE